MGTNYAAGGAFRDELPCRGCGKPIIFIKTGRYKPTPCDPEPVWVKQDPSGKNYIRKDGTTVIGTIAGDADDDPDSNFIEAYVSHFATCHAAGRFRKPRERKRPGHEKQL